MMFFGAHELSAENIDYIKERRELIACVSPRAEPYSDAILQIERPDYPGFNIDIAQRLADKIGVPLTLSWVQPFFNVSKSKCDVFMGVAISDGQDTYPFLKKTSPYLHVEDIFVAKKDYQLKNIQDFKGLRVAADTNTAAQNILRKNNSGAELFVSYIEDHKKLKALQQDEVDVAVVTSVALGWYQKNHPELKVKTTKASIIAANSKYKLALGLHNADDKTLALFNSYLTELRESGTLAKILEHYGVRHLEFKQN